MQPKGTATHFIAQLSSPLDGYIWNEEEKPINELKAVKTLAYIFGLKLTLFLITKK